MKTTFILLGQYDGLAVIPLEWVCRDYFRHLSVDRFLAKASKGEIIVRMEGSQKAAKGVHVEDLAAYLDQRTAFARKECEQAKRDAA